MKTCKMNWILALGLAALPAYGQTSQSAQPQQPAQKSPQKAKKVWTNDDLADLPANSPVSTASATPVVAPAEGPATGEATPAGGDKATAKSGALAPEKDPKIYQQKLQALRQRLADVEAKIKSTQDAISGSQGGSNALNLSQPTPVMRPQDQLAALEKERQDIQQQIEDLESQARQNGLSPGDIR